jgi:hypothetical protein
MSSAALRGRREEQQPQTHQVAVAGLATMEPRVPAAILKHEHQTRGQPARAQNVNSLPLDKMLNVVVTVVQQIMRELNGDVLEETRIVAITKIVLNRMEQNGFQEFVGPSESQNLMRMA